MTLRNIFFGFLVIGMICCKSDKKETYTKDVNTRSEVKIVGAMKNVMWKGELGSSIDLDTISDKNGLYGLGPESYLTGELLINDGKSYVSRVTSDSTMSVEKQFDVSAPFFVYANVTEWTEMKLPSNIKTLPDLEKYIAKKASDYKQPFAFKLIGQVSNADIHVQNLPKGMSVSSPNDAHQGQTSYKLNNEEAEIVGFFSTVHKGVFTHHDSSLHMHLITTDERKMGHLDKLEIGKMTLSLPKK